MRVEDLLFISKNSTVEALITNVTAGTSLYEWMLEIWITPMPRILYIVFYQVHKITFYTLRQDLI